MIFYLSGTGNTRRVAEQLGSGLGERLIDVSKASVQGSFDFQLGRDEAVGFCFPVHGWRPPNLLLDFIRNAKVRCAAGVKPYCFAVCTEGDTVGEAMDIFAKAIFEDLSLRLVSSFDVIMPNTYVGLPFMDVDDEKVEEQKLSAASSRISYILDRLRRRDEVFDIAHIGRWPRINSRFLGSVFLRWLVTDRWFKVDAGECLRCGRCTSACPIGNIDGGVGQLPQWKRQKKCMECFACYHNCPKHAIRFGSMTSGKGQYTCPVVKGKGL